MALNGPVSADGDSGMWPVCDSVWLLSLPCGICAILQKLRVLTVQPDSDFDCSLAYKCQLRWLRHRLAAVYVVMVSLKFKAG